MVGHTKKVFFFFVVIVKECREWVSPPKANRKSLAQPPLPECLNAQTLNGHRFSQLPATRKQTPHLLPLCVHPLPREGETRDNDCLITQGKCLKAAPPLVRFPSMPANTVRVAKGLYTCSSSSLLLDSSFSSKSPQQDEDDNFQMAASYL